MKFKRIGILASGVCLATLVTASALAQYCPPYCAPPPPVYYPAVPAPQPYVVAPTQNCLPGYQKHGPIGNGAGGVYFVCEPVPRG